MIKNKATIAGIIAAISVMFALVLFPLLRQPEGLPPSEPAQETDTAMNLGITYLRVTPKLAAYYDLGVDSGVLVTEVASGSLMDQASVQVGDVISSCNGVKLGEGVSLLGMTRASRPGDAIVRPQPARSRERPSADPLRRPGQRTRAKGFRPPPAWQPKGRRRAAWPKR